MIAALAALAVLACTVLAAEEPPADARSAILAIADQAVRAGMPDARGAEVWVGLWIDDLADERMLTRIKRLHLHLRDGRWLLEGIYLHADAPAATLLLPGARQVGAAELRPWNRQDGQPPAAGDANPLWFSSGRLGIATVLLPDLLVAPGEPDRPLEEDMDCFRAVPSAPRPGERHVAWSLAWRHSLIVHLLGMACHADTAAGGAGCLDAALALLTPEERSQRAAAMAALRTLAPWTLAYDLALAERLERWDFTVWSGYHRRSADDEMQGDHPPVRIQDTAALIALLDDRRPSRFIDRAGWPQTIGDRAADALRWLWGVDPRVIAGAAAAAPLGDAQRHAMATLVARLWTAGGGRSLLDGILADPVQLPLLWSTAVLATVPEAERPRAADAVLNAWSTMDPTARDAMPIDGFEEALCALGADPRIDDLVRSWPVAGPLALSLALWHEHRGDPAPLTARLRALLDRLRSAPPATAADAQAGELWTMDIMAVLHATALHPSPERFALLRGALEAGADTALPGFVARTVCAARRGYRWGGESPILDRLFGDFAGADAMVQALIDLALGDRRALSGAGRVCDAAAAAQWDAIVRDVPQLPARFPAADPLERRDAVLADARRGLDALLPARLASAGLTLPGVPGGAAAFPAWWAQELEAARADGRAVALLITSTRSCPPCDRLQREVLASAAWQAWASTRLRMVVYDFASIAEDDAEANARIRALGQWYPMGGTPSFFLIDAQGRQLGQRMAYEDVGPAGYIRIFSAWLGQPRQAP